MADSNEVKMYEIAKFLGELNAMGEVKGFSGNEKGYAKILQIKRGCSIWIHHLQDDSLVLDLMVSENASYRHPDITSVEIEKFKQFFKNDLNMGLWEHSIDENRAERYFIDIGIMETDEIKKLINRIIEHFGV